MLESTASLVKLDSTLVKSIHGWSLTAIPDAPDERQIEYITESGSRLPFRSFYTGGNDHIFYTFFGCDWRLIHSDGSHEEIPENQRQPIVDRIVLACDFLFPSQKKKIFDTCELLAGCPDDDPSDN